jgi:hypothetical protein
MKKKTNKNDMGYLHLSTIYLRIYSVKFWNAEWVIEFLLTKMHNCKNTPKVNDA